MGGPLTRHVRCCGPPHANQHITTLALIMHMRYPRDFVLFVFFFSLRGAHHDFCATFLRLQQAWPYVAPLCLPPRACPPYLTQAGPLDIVVPPHSTRVCVPSHVHIVFLFPFPFLFFLRVFLSRHMLTSFLFCQCRTEAHPLSLCTLPSILSTSFRASRRVLATPDPAPCLSDLPSFIF